MVPRRTAAVFSSLTTEISRHVSTATTAKPFSKIPGRYRSKFIQESQKAVTDYLHMTRSIPYLYAEHIATNSPFSLWKVVSKIPFSSSEYLHSFTRYLRYHPLNEVEFFLESIGLSNDGGSCCFLDQDMFFLSDYKHFGVVCALAGMGFPWSKMGLLCKDGSSVFDIEPSELERKVNEIKSIYGFDSFSLIGICLAFPHALRGGFDGLLRDLKVLFVDCGLSTCIEGEVDGVLEVCEKVRLFYDLGCEMGKICGLVGRSKTIFVDYRKEDLVQKIEFFSRLDVSTREIGKLLLSKPEILNFEPNQRAVSVSGFLKHFGLNEKKLKSLEEKYPHVFGRNRMANLPHILKSMDLSEWFFEQMKNKNHSLLCSYMISAFDNTIDAHYAEGLKTISSKRTYAHSFKKLNFLHSVGFGENEYAIRSLSLLNGTSDQLEHRFNFLVQSGIKHSNLCSIVKMAAKILNQQESSLRKKIDYLCNEMGSSLQYLDVFPSYLCYDLEKRIKPRYELHKWLVERGGILKNKYSLATIIATGEKKFVQRISCIDSDAAKRWQENSNKTDVL